MSHLLSCYSQKVLKDTPNIVCLCGSTRFKEDFIYQNFKLTMEGSIVLSVGFFSHADEETYKATEEEKKKLDELHLKKIAIADEVLILNVNGYIGESTRKEIEYARSLNKIIYYLEAPNQ